MVVLHVFVVVPVAFIPFHLLSFAADIVVSGQERLVFVAETFKSLQLAGAVHHSVVVFAYVKWNHADRVAGNDEIVLLLVV